MVLRRWSHEEFVALAVSKYAGLDPPWNALLYGAAQLLCHEMNHRGSWWRFWYRPKWRVAKRGHLSYSPGDDADRSFIIVTNEAISKGDLAYLQRRWQELLSKK